MNVTHELTQVVVIIFEQSKQDRTDNFKFRGHTVDQKTIQFCILNIKKVYESLNKRSIDLALIV